MGAQEHFNRGNEYLKQRAYKEAYGEYAVAIEQNPLFRQAYHKRGFACIRFIRDCWIVTIEKATLGGRYGQAEEAEIVRKEYVRRKSEEYASAIEDFDTAEKGGITCGELYRDRGFAHYEWGEILRMYGDEAAAKEHYKSTVSNLIEAVEHRPPKEEHREVCAKLGLAYAKLGDHNAAIKSYKKALELNPCGREVQCYLEVSYTALGEHNLSIENYGKSKSNTSPSTSEAADAETSGQVAFNLGVSYFKLKNYSAAISKFGESIPRNKSHGIAFLNRALQPVAQDPDNPIFVKVHYYSESVPTSERTLYNSREIAQPYYDRKLAETYYNRGLAYIAEDNPKRDEVQAKEDYLRAVEINPKWNTSQYRKPFEKYL